MIEASDVETAIHVKDDGGLTPTSDMDGLVLMGCYTYDQEEIDEVGLAT